VNSPARSSASRNGRIYGAIASFAGPADLLEAAKHLHSSGFRRYDTYSPYPIAGMEEALGLGHSKVPFLVLLGGLLGAGFAQVFQAYLNSVAYPLVTAGKPFNTPEAFVPITFETTVLCAAFGAVIGMFVLNGLPRLYHPVFRSESFKRASTDGFFLTVEARDPRFDLRKTPALLEALGGSDIELLEP
jgi:hypothetical protein